MLQIIFDLDDTLIITRHALIVARMQILHTYLKLINELDIQLALNIWFRLSLYYDSENLEIILPLISDELNLNQKFIRNDFIEIKNDYNNFEINNILLSKGADDIIRTCEQIGIPIAIYGNGNIEKQIKKLEKFPNLTSILSKGLFVFADGINFPLKPNPAGLLYLINKVLRANGKTAYVGDKITDVMTAKNAKCIAIQILSPSLTSKMPPNPLILKHEFADFTFANLLQLHNILKDGYYETFFN